MCTCNQCNQQIAEGTEYVCLDLHREIWSDPDSVHVTIDVLDAEVLLTLCMECASSRDFSRVVVPFRQGRQKAN